MTDAPRTKLEFLYQEVLGEVGELVTRIEQVNLHTQSVAERLEATHQAFSATPTDIRKAVEKSGKELAENLTKTTVAALNDVQVELQAMARDAARYAAIAHKSARTMALIALVVGGAAGVIGGLFAGFALSGLIG